MNYPAINTLNDKNFVSMEKFQDFDPNGEPLNHLQKQRNVTVVCMTC